MSFKKAVVRAINRPGFSSAEDYLDLCDALRDLQVAAEGVPLVCISDAPIPEPGCDADFPEHMGVWSGTDSASIANDSDDECGASRASEDESGAAGASEDEREPEPTDAEALETSGEAPCASHSPAESRLPPADSDPLGEEAPDGAARNPEDPAEEASALSRAPPSAVSQPVACPPPRPEASPSLGPLPDVLEPSDSFQIIPDPADSGALISPCGSAPSDVAVPTMTPQMSRNLTSARSGWEVV